MKVCRACGQEKPDTEFYKAKRNKDGLGSYCKPCHNAKTMAWAKAHPERVYATGRRYIEAHREQRQAQQRVNARRYYEKHGPRKIKDMSLRKLYGMTVEEYDALFKKQGGRCAICGNIPNGKALAVDHDHNTGRVRGLLCDDCNLGLGKFQDSPAILAKAALYLECSPIYYVQEALKGIDHSRMEGV